MGNSSQLKWPGPAVLLLLLGFLVSIVTLVIYLEESGYSDETLFLLLTILRYSSFMVCICAFYKLLVSFFCIFHERTVAVIKIIFYLLFLIYGAAIVFLESIIVVTARGTG